MTTEEIVVIKYGGSAMGQGFEEVMSDIAALWTQGVPIVLVHGGGKEISSLITRLGIEPEFRDGLRVTDAETLQAVEMVLAGSVNTRIVANLLGKGVRAFGMSGVDGGILTVVPKVPEGSGLTGIGPLGYVGDVKAVDVSSIELLLGAGLLPIVAPLGVDKQGQPFNINGDTAAGALAGALHARQLVLLTDVPGILRETPQGRQLVPTISPAEIRQLIADGTIYGGMIPKVEACLQAIDAGAQQVQILNGSEPHILLKQFPPKGVAVHEALGTTVKANY
ncbi:MAG: acetylglutamate kinase [Bacilli bacterium]|nr:acetylglutamate kinase [Bacilli bacterium]